MDQNPCQTPQQRHDALAELSTRLWAIRAELIQIHPTLTLQVDKKAVDVILTDLTWAVENCTVVAKHQIGEAMDDAMFLTGDGKVR